MNCCGRDSAATPIMAHALLLSLTPALGTGAGAEEDLWGSEIINQPGRSCISCGFATNPSGLQWVERNRNATKQKNPDQVYRVHSISE